MAIIAGPHFRLEKVNSKFKEIFGAHVIGESVFEARPELREHLVADAFKSVYRAGIPYSAREAPLPVRLKTGEVTNRFFDYSITRLYDFKGEPYGLYAHSVDVTDRVEARKQIDGARMDAEKASQAKTYFLANVSHELRTPLSAIVGFAEILKEKQLPDNERVEFLEKISRHGSALARIIDDLLDLTKLEYGNSSVKMGEVSLHALIEDTVDVFREKAAAKKLSLVYQPNPSMPKTIHSDPIRLRQILINLIGNAVKFTDTGSINVRAEYEPVDADKIRVRLIVSDTGIGVTDEQLAKLFRPFAQGDDSMARRYGGFGLGLAISRKLSESLGGSVEFTANPESRGSTFTASFLTTKCEEPASACAVNAGGLVTNGPLLSQRKILVADDSSDNLFLVKRLLSKNGAKVVVATNGSEAVQAAKSENPDAILMDIQMPGLDGYEATRQLRAHGFLRPIFALTAHAMAEDRERSASAGCDGHLTKPLNGPEVIRALQHALRKS